MADKLNLNWLKMKKYLNILKFQEKQTFTLKYLSMSRDWQENKFGPGLGLVPALVRTSTGTKSRSTWYPGLGPGQEPGPLPITGPYLVLEFISTNRSYSHSFGKWIIDTAVI